MNKWEKMLLIAGLLAITLAVGYKIGIRQTINYARVPSAQTDYQIIFDNCGECHNYTVE